MSPFDPNAYGPTFAALLSIDRNRALDAGHPDRGARAQLNQLTLEPAFAHTNIRDADMARCCLAAVWLLHDELDESHQISQAIDTPTGSYWHAIMHRREGDFSNAKYWLRRVGHHEVFESLGQLILGRMGSPRSGNPSTHLAAIVPNGQFDPYAFTNAVQSALGAGGDAEALCRQIQQFECELLFHHCYAAAL